MPKDPIQDVAKLVETVVRTHGAQALLGQLSLDVRAHLLGAMMAEHAAQG